jgi:hypothetical protein
LRYRRRFGIAPNEALRVEASQRVATAEVAEPSDVEPFVLSFDAVSGRELSLLVGTDREPGEDVTVLVKNGLELGLALANATDRGLFHGWSGTEDSRSRQR